MLHVRADDQGLLTLMRRKKLVDDLQLARRTSRQTISFAGLCGGVGEAFFVGKRGAHFHALGGGDVAGHLEFFPGAS